jgi:putative hemolysin
MLLLSLALGLLLVTGSLMAQTQGNTSPPMPRPSTLDPGRFVLQFGVVFALILLNAFFALAEIALLTVRKTRVRQLVEEGNRSAILVERLLAQPTRLMATIQTGVTMIAMFSSAIAATSAVDPLASWMRTHLGGIFAHSAQTIALIAVTLPVAILSLVVGEIAPKSLAVRHPERLALLAVRPIHWLEVVLTPVVTVLDRLANVIVRPFGGTASFTTQVVNEEELKMMVEASEEQGVLEAEETEMIHSILDFGDTVVRKVMTPRIDMTTLEVDAPVSALAQKISESGHSRIPVYEGDLDNIVGIVHAKDLLNLFVESPRDSVSLRDVMRPPYFIPETKKIDELLTEFQRTKQQMALVRDEYGTVTGVVTIEDLLEEIVGDIQDEYDVEEPMVQVIDANTTLLNGKMSLSDVNDRMGLDLPEEEDDTIGGFVFSLLGHQAEQGERVRWENLEFGVEETDGRRITKVRLVRHPEPESTHPPTPDETSDADTNGLSHPERLTAEPPSETPLRR